MSGPGLACAPSAGAASGPAHSGAGPSSSASAATEKRNAMIDCHASSGTNPLIAHKGTRMSSGAARVARLHGAAVAHGRRSGRGDFVAISLADTLQQAKYPHHHDIAVRA